MRPTAGGWKPSPRTFGPGWCKWVTTAPVGDIDARWDEFEQRHFWPRVVPPEARGTYQPPADAILPEYQDLSIGDIIPDGPPGSAWYTVERLEPNRAMVLYATTHFKYAFPALKGTRYELTGAFSWAFVLEPVDERRTRLTLVNRTAYEPRMMRFVLNPMYRLVDGIHQRAILERIKRRVERTPEEVARARHSSGVLRVERARHSSTSKR
jgi:hypothetical protein